MSWKERADDELKKPRKGGSFKLKEEENDIRILPTKQLKKDKDPYVYSIHNIHTNVGPDKRVTTCGKNSSGNGDCWLCDKQLPKDEASDSKSKQKRAELMAPKEVMTLQIAIVEHKKWRGPEPFSMNMGGKKSLAYKILKTIKNPKYDCVDPKKGRNISIEREGQGLATVYGSPVISPEKSEVPEKILKRMRTFDEMIPKYNEDKQKAAYRGKEESSTSSSNSSSSNGDRKMAKKKVKDSSAASSAVSSAASSSAASSSAGSSSTASSAKDSSAASSSAGSSAKSSKASSSAPSSSAASSNKSSAKSSAASSATSSAASSAASSEQNDKPKGKGKGKGKGKVAAKGKGKGKKAKK